MNFSEPRLLLISIFFLIGSLVAQGAERAAAASSPALDKVEAVDPESIRQPMLSAEGRRRLSENISVLDDNLDNAKKNLEAAKKNIKVIDQEMKDLDVLEKEHAELKEKYEDYLKKAEGEMEKNGIAVKKLDSFLKEAPKGPSTSKEASEDRGAQARKIQSERTEREHWRVDAVAKMQKVHELQVKLAANVRDIQSRRGPLQTEKQTWVDRKAQYEKLLTELNQKRSTLEKLAKK